MNANCPHCGSKCAIPETLVGRKVRCPKCRQTFVFAAESPNSPPAVAPIPASAPIPIAVPVSPKGASVPAANPISPSVPVSLVDEESPAESAESNGSATDGIDFSEDRPPDPATLSLLFSLARFRADPNVRNWVFHRDGHFARVYREGQSIDWFPHKDAPERFVLPTDEDSSCIEFTTTEGKRYKFHSHPDTVERVQRYVDDARAYDARPDDIDIPKVRSSADRNIVGGIVIFLIGVVIGFVVENAVLHPVDRVNLRRLWFIAAGGLMMIATGVGQHIRASRQQGRVKRTRR